MLLLGVAVTKGRRTEKSKHVVFGLRIATSADKDEISYRQTMKEGDRPREVRCKDVINVIYFLF